MLGFITNLTHYLLALSVDLFMDYKAGVGKDPV